ncbi:MAG: pectate lyase [Phycisphaerae bacterium]|nr:pectate lyase [Phycisphaerae bacterium]
MKTLYAINGRTLFLKAAAVLLCLCGMGAQATVYWDRYAAKPDEWFGGPEARKIADNILTWQDAHGSWPKNLDTASKPFSGSRKDIEGTFDNQATTGEMRFLARAYKATQDLRYQEAFLKALDLIIQAQYPTGGWPQSYPPGKDYSRHITFNDGAMVRLMELLEDIASEPAYDFVDASRRQMCRQAFENGVQCILKCQIRVNGKLTVWCAQHDEMDYSPRPARTYELASLSGGESAEILRLLMELDNPSPAVIEAIQAGVQWYESSKIEGIRIALVNGQPTAVSDPQAKPMWARFYEIQTNRPFFCDRDGIPKYDYNQLGLERRKGYAWYGNWGEDVFKNYQKWRQRWEHLMVAEGTKILLIIGDSTVCSWPETDARRGWGQYIQPYFMDAVKVINHARSGRSTKTFIKEGLWSKALAVKPDWVLIQFGHNDSHDPNRPESTNADTDYSDYLRYYIDQSRAAGAIPVLITPMHRRNFDSRGKMKDVLLPYANAMKKVANEKKVALVDLHKSSGELFESLGPAGSEELANQAGDKTHFNQKGAKLMAELVMRDLPNVEPSLKKYIKEQK